MCPREGAIQTTMKTLAVLPSVSAEFLCGWFGAASVPLYLGQGELVFQIFCYQAFVNFQADYNMTPNG